MLAGVLLVAASDFWVLVIAGTIGVVSVSGGEVGPFEASSRRRSARSWRTGHARPSSAGTAGRQHRDRLRGTGGRPDRVAVVGGRWAVRTLEGYRAVVLGYAADRGRSLALTFAVLSPRVEGSSVRRAGRSARGALRPPPFAGHRPAPLRASSRWMPSALAGSARDSRSTGSTSTSARNRSSWRDLLRGQPPVRASPRWPRPTCAATGAGADDDRDARCRHACC